MSSDFFFGSLKLEEEARGVTWCNPSFGEITPESFRGIEHEKCLKPLVVLQGGNLKLGTRAGPWQFAAPGL